MTACKCAIPDTIRMHAFDTRAIPEGATERIIAAIGAAAEAVCCSQAANAMYRAAFDAARAEGLGIARGTVLKDAENGGPLYVVWPIDTWRKDTLRDFLAEHNAYRITPRDLAGVS